MHLVGLDPDDVRRPLPAPALRRPAAAGRRGPRARRGPAGAADGRAVRRRRPGGPRPAAGRVPAAPARARQDGAAGHPRHRRGGEDGRPGRGLRRRRPARAVRRAGRDPRRARPTTSCPSSSAAPAACAGWPSPRSTATHLEPMDGVTAAELGGTIDAAATPRGRAGPADARGQADGRRHATAPTFLGVLTPNGVHRALRASVSSQE